MNGYAVQKGYYLVIARDDEGARLVCAISDGANQWIPQKELYVTFEDVNDPKEIKQCLKDIAKLVMPKNK